jgi:hypothetical protein
LVVTIALVTTLVPIYGVKGGIIAMLLSELALISCFAFYMRDYILGGEMLCTVVVVVGALAISTWIYLWLSADDPAILVATVLPCLCYLVLVIASGQVGKAVRFLGVSRARRGDTGLPQ